MYMSAGKVERLHALGAGGGYMDLMTAEQAGHFLQSQANHQSSSLANGDLPHAHHAQATHNGHQVAAGLAQVMTTTETKPPGA